MWTQCKACFEDGVNAGASVCTICHSNQNDFPDEPYLADEWPYLSIPTGIIAALYTFAQSYESAGIGWGSVFSVIAGIAGYYLSPVIACIIIAMVLIAIFF